MIVKKLGYGNLRSLTTTERYPYRRASRRLCGFELRGQEWVAVPQALFRPSALMLWDVPDVLGALVDRWLGKGKKERA